MTRYKSILKTPTFPAREWQAGLQRNLPMGMRKLITEPANLWPISQVTRRLPAKQFLGLLKSNIGLHFIPLAQLDSRVSRYEREGRQFESVMWYQN